MLDDGFDTFVEIGPHPVLVRGAEALIEKLDADAMMAPSMTRKEPEVTVFLQSLARLAARGFEPDMEVSCSVPIGAMFDCPRIRGSTAATGSNRRQLRSCDGDRSSIPF